VTSTWVRSAASLALLVFAQGCVSSQQGAANSPEVVLARKLEEELRRNDDVGVRAQLASTYLSLSGWPGAPRSERLENARRALEHADQAILLDSSRVEGHYYRAVSIGRILDAQLVPDLSLVSELEAAGVRARELDPSFDQAGPLRLLALLYWQAPAWPVGPEPAGDHEVIEGLFHEALTLAWGSAENHLCYAEYLSDRDRLTPAAEHLRMANDLLATDTSLPEREKPDLRRRIAHLGDDLLHGTDPRKGKRPAPFRRTDDAAPPSADGHTGE
jgi:hypothetical protein